MTNDAEIMSLTCATLLLAMAVPGVITTAIVFGMVTYALEALDASPDNWVDKVEKPKKKPKAMGME